jgi:deoxyribodipyrimidine photo-lyase
MYTAALFCNIGRAHWRQPARWMYYHLLDGDWASNACSWQWVAGANSSKTYLANQENINRYTGSKQMGTYLDCSYEALADLNPPEVLSSVSAFEGKTSLPSTSPLVLLPHLPVFVYNYYHLLLINY